MKDMKNNKGFTLVELLVVMSLLIILALMIYPTVDNYINKGKEGAYTTQIETIKAAAKNWAADNSSELPDNGETIKVRLDELVNSGYMEELIDPKTGEEILTSSEVVIENKNGTIQYSVNIIE